MYTSIVWVYINVYVGPVAKFKVHVITFPIPHPISFTTISSSTCRYRVSLLNKQLKISL